MLIGHVIYGVSDKCAITIFETVIARYIYSRFSRNGVLCVSPLCALASALYRKVWYKVCAGYTVQQYTKLANNPTIMTTCVIVALKPPHHVYMDFCWPRGTRPLERNERYEPKNKEVWMDRQAGRYIVFPPYVGGEQVSLGPVINARRWMMLSYCVVPRHPRG